jgi:hypothetical protein
MKALAPLQTSKMKMMRHWLEYEKLNTSVDQLEQHVNVSINNVHPCLYLLTSRIG